MPKNLSRTDLRFSIEQFYTPIHARIAAHEVREPRPTIQEFKKTSCRFSIPPAGVALDAGCGGTAAAAIACANHGFRSVHAIDINHESLRNARGFTGADSALPVMGGL